MKRLATTLMVAALPLLPGAAWAGSSTDAALALGSFAVFNQIIGGTGIFAGLAPAPQPVYAAPPPPVYVAPPPPVYVVPRPVHVTPRPVYVAPRPVVVYERAAPVHYKHHGHKYYDRKHDGKHWKHYRHD